MFCSYVALSSTASTKTVWNSNLTIWAFETTPPIPTYIFNVAIGQFKSYCEEKEEINKEICIWRMKNFENWNKTGSALIKRITQFQVKQSGHLHYNKFRKVC